MLGSTAAPGTASGATSPRSVHARVSEFTPLGGMPGTANCFFTAFKMASASTTVLSGASGDNLPSASMHCVASLAVSALAALFRHGASIAAATAEPMASRCLAAATPTAGLLRRPRERALARSLAPSARRYSPRDDSLSAPASRSAARSGSSAAASGGWRSNADWKKGALRRHRLLVLNTSSASR